MTSAHVMLLWILIRKTSFSFHFLNHKPCLFSCLLLTVHTFLFYITCLCGCSGYCWSWNVQLEQAPPRNWYVLAHTHTRARVLNSGRSLSHPLAPLPPSPIPLRLSHPHSSYLALPSTSIHPLYFCGAGADTPTLAVCPTCITLAVCAYSHDRPRRMQN